jgi:Putative transposase
MAQTAAHFVDAVIPPVPVRQWALSLPIPLRILLVGYRQLLSGVIQIVHRAIATFLIKPSGLKRTETHTGAVTLIQRFGSGADLNIHVHCLVLDGVYLSHCDGATRGACRCCRGLDRHPTVDPNRFNRSAEGQARLRFTPLSQSKLIRAGFVPCASANSPSPPPYALIALLKAQQPGCERDT